MGSGVEAGNGDDRCIRHVDPLGDKRIGSRKNRQNGSNTLERGGNQEAGFAVVGRMPGRRGRSLGCVRFMMVTVGVNRGVRTCYRRADVRGVQMQEARGA